MSDTVRLHTGRWPPISPAILESIRTTHPTRRKSFLFEIDKLMIDQDDPRKFLPTNPQWQQLLKDIIFARQLLRSEDKALKVRIARLIDILNSNRYLTKMRIQENHVGEIVAAVQHLLHTSATDSGSSSASSNVAFLTDCFENDPLNQTLLTSSALYKWASVDAWRHHPSCPHFNGDASADQEQAAQCETQNSPEDIVEEALADGPQSSTPVRGTYRSLRRARHAIREPPRSVPFHVMDSDEGRMCQLSAKLHCLYGVPVQEVQRAPTSPQRYALRSDTAPIHPYARSKVYDLRQHTMNTLWGPFVDDGSQQVDWEKLEAIMIILDHNLKDYDKTHFIPSGKENWKTWYKSFEGVSPYSYKSARTSLPREVGLSLEAQDPYNVSGTWLRIVCFLDYSELFDFNFTGNVPPPGHPRPALDTEEATRLIIMKLTISKIERPSEEDSPDHPVVHFSGSATALPRSWDPSGNSSIRGTVRTTPHGDVRWTSISVFQGEERWKSEGIQIGGVQSARGVLGFWFDKGYDEHGPAGPTAFWKANDDNGLREDGDGGRGAETDDQPHHHFHGLHMPLY